MPEKRIYIDGRFYTERNAKMSVFDHGLLYGDGIFETMLAGNGTVFKLDEHVSRLFRSAKLISLKTGLTRNAVKKIIYKALRKNRLKDAYVRFAVTRGKGKVGLSPNLCPKPSVFVIAERFKPLPEAVYRKGVGIIISKTRRNIPSALDPRIKSSNFLNNILAKIEAQKYGAFDAVMLNAAGCVAEASVSNIFFARGGVLKTPALSAGILPGITRSNVLKLAKKLKIKTEQGLYKPAELSGADEVFLTNTSLGIMPVSKIGNSPVNNKKNLNLTAKLQSAYKEFLINSCG